MPSLLEHLQARSAATTNGVVLNRADDNSGAADADAGAAAAAAEVREWLGKPGSGEILLNENKKTTLWNECSSATTEDCVTLPNAITPFECKKLIDLWRSHYQPRTGPKAASDLTGVLDSVDGRPSMQLDVETPLQFINQQRLKRLWAIASMLPIAAADDKNTSFSAGEVSWDGESCSAFVRRYTNGVRQSIKWHADAAAYTINIALNDASEYSGGQLDCLLRGGIKSAERTYAGCATVHGANVLHTVRPVKSGERFSLILFIRKEDGIELRRKWRDRVPMPPPLPTPPSPNAWQQPRRPVQPSGGRRSIENQLLYYGTAAWDHVVLGKAWLEDAPEGFSYIGQATNAGRPVKVIRLKESTLISFEGLLIQPAAEWTFKMASSSNGPGGVVPPRPSRELLAEELTNGLIQIVPGEVLPAGDDGPLRLKGSAAFFSHICKQCQVPLGELTSDVLLFDELRKFANSPEVQSPQVVRKVPPGSLVSLIGQYSLNYYHFLMKSAPSLVAALYFLRPSNMRVVTYDAPHALELCELLGISRERLVIFRPNELLLTECDQLHCTTGLNPSTDFPSKETVRKLREALLPQVAARTPSGVGWTNDPNRVRVLLLNRRGEKTRVLAEDDQARVEDVILQHFRRRPDAFELVAPGRWPPPGIGTQHRLFAGADVVIGPHGAALANCVWMKSGSVLLELRPSIRRGWLSKPGDRDVGEYELLSSLVPGVRYVKVPVPGGWDVGCVGIDSAVSAAILQGLSLL